MTMASPANATYLDDFEVSGKAVIEWQNNSSETQFLADVDPPKKHAVFEVFFQSRDNIRRSFFKLRIPVQLKHVQQPATFLYLFIPPNHVASLDGTSGCDEVPDAARNKLNGSITRLHFHLCTPGLFIVPAYIPLEPRKPATADVIGALRALAQATTISIYLEDTTLSKDRIQALQNAAESGMQPLTRHLDLSSLYNGKGARIFVNSPDQSIKEVEEPPSYNEIGPGPPMPPTSEVWPSDVKDRKRRRPDSSGSDCNTRIYNVKKREYDIGEQVLLRLEQLEGLVREQQHEISTLRAQVASLEDDLAACQARSKDTDEAVGILEARASEHEELLAEVDDKVRAVWDVQDESVDRIHDEVYDKVRGDIFDLAEEVKDDMLRRMRSAFDPSCMIWLRFVTFVTCIIDYDTCITIVFSMVCSHTVYTPPTQPSG